MSDRELVDALLRPDDEDPWKVAAGWTLGQLREQTAKTNGRVTRLERLSWAAGGAFALLSLLGVSTILQLIGAH